MKKVIIGVVAAGIGVVALFVGGLLVAGSSARDVQRDFVDAFESENTDKLMAMMHPKLKEQVDEPMVAALMQAVKEKLGKITDVTQTEFNVQAGSGVSKKSNANLTFERGTGTSEIDLVDGQLVSFKIESEQLGDWFERPATTTLYEQTGEQFLRKMLGEEVESAWSMCHTALQDTVTKDGFTEMSDAVSKQTGPIVSATVKEAMMTDGELAIVYDIKTEKQEGVLGSVKFQFQGMKGHILGFNVKPPTTETLLWEQRNDGKSNSSETSGS